MRRIGALVGGVGSGSGAEAAIQAALNDEKELAAMEALEKAWPGVQASKPAGVFASLGDFQTAKKSYLKS